VLQACLHKPDEENRINSDAKQPGFVLLQGLLPESADRREAISLSPKHSITTLQQHNKQPINSYKSISRIQDPAMAEVI